ncbi:MAG TPA: hypothetical protein VL418_00675, partial [Devosiaceae bacterium]|nr:hypothetical protein [Devosiaceae bacterium]
GMLEHNFDLLFSSDPAAARNDGGGVWLSILDQVAARHAVVFDSNSRDRLLEELRRTLEDAALRLNASAEGDYSRDTNVDRFPAVEECWF